MTLAEFEQEVALATGESIDTIRERGFSLVEMPPREPQVIDWDELYDAEPVRPVRLRRKASRSRAA